MRRALKFHLAWRIISNYGGAVIYRWVCVFLCYTDVTGGSRLDLIEDRGS